jgi:hypothetical protein
MYDTLDLISPVDQSDTKYHIGKYEILRHVRNTNKLFYRKIGKNILFGFISIMFIVQIFNFECNYLTLTCISTNITISLIFLLYFVWMFYPRINPYQKFLNQSSVYHPIVTRIIADAWSKKKNDEYITKRLYNIFMFYG